MTLMGAEDFNGAAGTTPNSAYWDYDLGGGGWRNGEQQVYTRNPENVRLSGTGNLIIEARRKGNSYTSTHVVTRGKVGYGYGLVEARIKFPEGQGYTQRSGVEYHDGRLPHLR
jgi:beta-glucanase (GH16 family)